MAETKPPPVDGNAREAALKPEARMRPRWPLLLAALVVLIFIAVVLFLIFTPKSSVWTDDAHVMVHYSTISPRVSGQVIQVLVDDNQIVHQGDLLATLDDRDYRSSVDQAEAALERDRANLDNAGAAVARQPAEIEEARALVASAQAHLAYAQADARRYSNLAATGAGTTQERQSSQTTLEQDQAGLQSAKATLDAQLHQFDGLKAQHSAIEATVKLDEAQLHQAKLNLSYTRITAPMDGMIGVRSTQVGNYVTPGAGLMSVVPLHEVYIEANYREVDLLHVERGQHVRIHVDAYDIDLDGVVDSIPPATGATFSPIQPDDATGNFTKIVQRLPVKIVLSPAQRLAQLLRVGMSVETTIDTGLADVIASQRRSPAPVTAR